MIINDSVILWAWPSQLTHIHNQQEEGANSVPWPLPTGTWQSFTEVSVEILMSLIKEIHLKKGWNQLRALPVITGRTEDCQHFIQELLDVKKQLSVWICIGICLCMEEKLDGKSFPALHSVKMLLFKHEALLGFSVLKPTRRIKSWQKVIIAISEMTSFSSSLLSVQVWEWKNIGV